MWPLDGYLHHGADPCSELLRWAISLTDAVKYTIQSCANSVNVWCFSRDVRVRHYRVEMLKKISYFNGRLQVENVMMAHHVGKIVLI